MNHYKKLSGFGKPKKSDMVKDIFEMNTPNMELLSMQYPERLKQHAINDICHGNNR